MCREILPFELDNTFGWVVEGGTVACWATGRGSTEVDGTAITDSLLVVGTSITNSLLVVALEYVLFVIFCSGHFLVNEWQP